MQVGLISDIHANLPGLRAVLTAMDGIDTIICAGDLTGYYCQPNEVIQELLDRNVIFIAGNHDVYLQKPPAAPNPLLQKSLSYTRSVLTPSSQKNLAGLTCEKRLPLGGLQINVYHGSPWDPQEQYIYPDFVHWERFAGIDADVIVMGHTHRPLLKKIDHRLIVNPGSCGQPRDGDPRASYAVLDTDARSIEFGRAEYDVAAVQREAAAAGLTR